jgi:hypothetical protein
MAWTQGFAAPISRPPEGFADAPFRPQAVCLEVGIPPSKPQHGHRRQAPHFDKNTLVFWGASIRHDFGQGAHDSA